MRVSTIIKVLLKAIIVPVIVVFGLSKFNLFEYMTFIPTDYQYEVGLTFYLAFMEAVYGFVENAIEQKKSKITCTFYVSDADRNIENTPLIVCDNDVGVAIINCHLEVSGNLKKIRKSVLKLELPSWLTAQINVQDTVLSYGSNVLSWKFDRMLPSTGVNSLSAEYKSRISLIKNSSGDNMTIKLEPQIQKKWGLKFETNGFRIQNGA